MVVSVDVAGLLHERRDVAHRSDLRLAVQPLAGKELLDCEAALRRIPDLAEKGRDGLQVVDRDVAANVDGIAAQQIAQERHPHCRALHVVVDRHGEIPGADAVISRVMEPVRLRELVRKRGLSHARHAEQRDGLVLPSHELGPGHLHGVSRPLGGPAPRHQPPSIPDRTHIRLDISHLVIPRLKRHGGLRVRRVEACRSPRSLRTCTSRTGLSRATRHPCRS